MSSSLLTPREAAQMLGVSVATLYDWLGQIRQRLVIIRGRSVTVDYLQGDPEDKEESELKFLKCFGFAS